MSFKKLQGHTGWKIDNLNPKLSKITRPVAAIKSLRFALLVMEHSHKFLDETFSTEYLLHIAIHSVINTNVIIVHEYCECNYWPIIHVS